MAEIAGFSRWLLKLNPSSSPDQYQASRACVQWYAAIHFAEHFPREKKLMQDKIDNVLCRLFDHAVQAKKSPAEFLEENEGLWQLSMPAVATERLLALSDAEKGWAAEVVALEEVLGTPLGCKIFGFAATEILVARIGSVIESEVKELLKKKPITVAGVSASKQALPLAALGDLSKVPAKRVAQCSYRQFVFDVPVRSIEEEVEVRYAAAIRGEAVACGLLSSLPGEVEVFGSPSTGQEEQVEHALIADATSARKSALLLLQGLSNMAKVEDWTGTP
eukprot:6466219-Amphidinium_carterae.2